ncbi:IS30 family transposase [Streptomyces cinereoruber]|uniref:IS30 family transposase n=1 Tax=Streptomyces cinereoruber TaxID=67260 RepID=UPI003C3043D1
MDFEIRNLRTVAQGRSKLVREREEYFRLMSEGMSSQEACRVVGINYRTGKRWRNGRAPSKKTPVRDAWTVRGERVVSGARYLTQDERLYIADRVREKVSLRVIAAELERSPSTISREIRRNQNPKNGDYRPFAAQARADTRKPRPRHGKVARHPELKQFVQDHLDRRWSPEQICQALRRRFPDRPELHVVHETIYQALYVQGRGELRRDLARNLRTGRAVRKHHREPHQRRHRSSMLLISDRPAEVEDRAVPGHWEGDLIIGKESGSAIGTLVERSTRYLMLVHLPDGRSSTQVRDALIDTVGTLPAHLRRSVTWDQGIKMRRHLEFTVATNVPVYFCDPASPWQRGSNENTNGLLRQYFPKGTDLSRHTHEHLDAVAAELNNRPRKTLNWDTPAARLHQLRAV